MSALRDKYAIVGTGKSRLGQVGAEFAGAAGGGDQERARRSRPDQQGRRRRRGARRRRHLFPSPDGRGSGSASTRASAPRSTTAARARSSSIILAVMAIEAGLATRVVCGYGRDSWSRTHRQERRRHRQRTTSSRRRSGRRSTARSSAISARCRSTPSARAGTCSNTAPRATISPRSPWRSASTRCAIPKRR